MSVYIAQILLEVNGQNIDDFRSATEKEIEQRKEVKLMNKVGVVSINPIYKVEVEYVVPSDVPEFDFENVSNGTLTLDLENGVRKTYSGVYTLKVGDTKYGDEKEATRVITFVAMKRTIQ
jgi:hypothetical protein